MHAFELECSEQWINIIYMIIYTINDNDVKYWVEELVKKKD